MSMIDRAPPSAPMPDFDEIQGWITRIVHSMPPQDRMFLGGVASPSLPFCLGHVFDHVEIVEASPLAKVSGCDLFIPVSENIGMWLGRWQGRYFGLEGEVPHEDIQARAHRVIKLWTQQYNDPVEVIDPLRLRAMSVQEWNETFGNLWQEAETHMIHELRAAHQAFITHHALQVEVGEQPPGTAPPRRRF